MEGGRRSGLLWGAPPSPRPSRSPGSSSLSPSPSPSEVRGLVFGVETMVAGFRRRRLPTQKQARANQGVPGVGSMESDM